MPSVISPIIEEIEGAISAIRWGKKEGPTVFNSPEIHALAADGEFELRGGSGRTVGGSKPEDVGLAYDINKGLIIESSQLLADSMAKEIHVDRLLAHAGILVVAFFV